MAQLSITRDERLEGIFYLPDRPVVLGRADGVDIQLLDSRVSRRHSVIRQSVAGYMIQDLNTKNGTFVNRESIEKSLLFHGDSIVIGGYTLHFLEEEPIQDLDSQAIEEIRPSEPRLTVPDALSSQASPRARTRAGSPVPTRRGDAEQTGKAQVKESHTHIPVIEGLSADESAAGTDESS